jgi:hypothetical protein
MHRVTRLLTLACVGLLSAAPKVSCQQRSDPSRFDLAGLVGGAKIPGSTFPSVGGQTTSVASSATVAWQANFGWRIFRVGPATASVELPFASAPSQSITGTTDIGGLKASTSVNGASYFFTPGLRVRFTEKIFAPYVAAGAGFERATQFKDVVTVNSSGGFISTNFTPVRAYKGAFGFAGGLDARLSRLWSLRSEIRDFVRMGETGGQSGRFIVVQTVIPSRNTVAINAGLVARF